MSRYGTDGLTDDERFYQAKLQWEAHARTPAGRLEWVRLQLDCLTAEVVALESLLAADESVDLGATPPADDEASGVDLTAPSDPTAAGPAGQPPGLLLSTSGQ